MSEIIENVRDRKFISILYPDDETHVSAMGKLMTEGYNFAAILHDKDLHEDAEHDGDPKKPHWHVVLKFKNPVWSNSVAKNLGIAPNYIKQAKSLDGALCYLVHFGFEGKYQYDIEEVFGSLSSRVAFLVNDQDESTRALSIYDLIRNSPGIVSYSEIFEKVCKSGMYGDFRRMGSGVMYLINEHNWEFTHYEQNTVGLSQSIDRFNDNFRFTCSGTGDVQQLDGCAPFRPAKPYAFVQDSFLQDEVKKDGSIK